MVVLLLFTTHPAFCVLLVVELQGKWFEDGSTETCCEARAGRNIKHTWIKLWLGQRVSGG